MIGRPMSLVGRFDRESHFFDKLDKFDNFVIFTNNTFLVLYFSKRGIQDTPSYLNQTAIISYDEASCFLIGRRWKAEKASLKKQQRSTITGAAGCSI